MSWPHATLWRNALFGQTGPILGVPVAVYVAGTSELAQLWVDEAKTAPLANPLPVNVAENSAGLDVSGNLRFAVDAGDYQLGWTDPTGTHSYDFAVGVNQVDIADQAPSSGAPGPAPWKPPVPYSSTAVYHAATSVTSADSVSYRGSSYVALVPSVTGVAPGTDPAKWALIAAAATSNLTIDVSSFAGYDPSGLTPSDTALTAALAAVTAGGPRTLVFPGTPQITQQLLITDALRGLKLTGTDATGVNVGSQLQWGGTGVMIQLGTDIHPTDRGGVYYDGPQTLVVEDLTLVPTNAKQTGTLASGQPYAPGTTCIRDWYSGDVRLVNAIIRFFDVGFEGHQSDLNNWTNAQIHSCNTGISLEVRSDQFRASGLYMFLCNRALDLRGVSGAWFHNCTFVGNGSATVNPIAIRQSADIVQGCQGVFFTECWFEMYQGYAGGNVEAFVEVGVGDAAQSLDVHFRNPSIGTKASGQLPHTQYLAKIGNGDVVSVENPTWRWANLDKLVKFVGSTSPGVLLRGAAVVAAQSAFGSTNAGTGTPVVTVQTWGA